MNFKYTDYLPIVKIMLWHDGNEITVPAVIDSGAMVSVLPYDLGLKLGFVWEKQTIPVELGGTCGGIPAFGVLIRGELAGLPPVALAFAWTRKTSSEIRTLLGHTNFFQHYKVTFEAYDNKFDVAPKK